MRYVLVLSSPFVLATAGSTGLVTSDGKQIKVNGGWFAFDRRWITLPAEQQRHD